MNFEREMKVMRARGDIARLERGLMLLWCGGIIFVGAVFVAAIVLAALHPC